MAQHVQQQQDSALGTERLTSLHAKLHQEADKIRKWKVQTEMDMKHKDKKLGEANVTIESLRKSILELQLENENLSTKLQDELGNREEVLQRVKNTRDLVGLLKDQEERLEEKLSSCETERTELKYLEKEHAQQFEEMTAEFRRLQMETKHDVDDLIKQGAAQQQVCNLSSGLASTQQQLDKFKNECALLQNEKEQLATELIEERDRADSAKRQEDSVQEALNNSVAIFNQRQRDLQKDIDLLKAELSEEQKRLKEARAQLTESLTFNESLKSSRELQTEKYKNKAEISSLETEVESLQCHLQQEQQVASRLQVQVDEINPRYASLEKEKKHLQQELHNLKQTISTHQNELEKTLQAQSEGSKQTQHLQENIIHLQTELSGAREEKDSVQARLADLERENHHLQQEQESKGQVVEKERQTSNEKCEHLEQQLKEVGADIKAKNKAIKDLEKELKSVRGKLTTQEKKQEERSREVDYLKQELSASEQVKQQSDKIIASLQAHLEQETQTSKNNAQQVEQLQREMAQALKEKTDAMMQCERQIIEMTATLEKYTGDHQKLLMQKDKTIEELHSKNTQLDAITQEKESCTKNMREESERLQQLITALKSEMDNPVSTLATSVPTTPVAQVQGQQVENQQRSILRQTGTISRRRKVAFISPSIDASEKSNTDSDSSIDLEIEDEGMSHKKPGPRTPLRLRHSPHKNKSVVSTPVILTPSRNLRLDAIAKKSKLKHNVRTAMGNSPEAVQIKEKEFCKTPNMRKAPMRTSRFFRTSPKERKIAKQQEEAKERMAWFDDDNVYGFGFDD
ncbi:hypothetical protein ACOMHN_029812 [Nucella lapillus]